MTTETLTEKPIVNIVKVEIVTEEQTPKTYVFNTASEATYSAVVSEGTENILRIKNEIKAIDRTEDIQYGSDLTLKQPIFVPEVLCIVDGGTLTKTEDVVTGYKPPVQGSVVNRTLFTLNIYTEEKDADTTTVGYQKFSFKGCKGKPASFNFKDGEFMAPEYTIMSRVKKGTAPYELTFLDALPTA